jgi:uncharacterized protein
MERILGNDWMLPGLDDLNREWFTRGRVCVQSCDACGEVQHPPELICPACGGADLSFKDSAGTGKVESHIIVRQAVHPGLADQCPYAVLVVSLDDYPSVNVIGNLAGDPETPLEVGQAVRAVFELVEDSQQGTLRIPQWEVLD